MKYPNILTVDGIKASTESAEINGRWVAARPLGFASWSHRIKAAWMVLTGKADAVKWPEGQ